MNLRLFHSSIYIILFSSSFFAQSQQIEIAEIWAKGLFFPDQVEGLAFLKDDNYYSLLEFENEASAPALVKYPVKGGEKEIIISSSAFTYKGTPILPTSYDFSEDNNKILLQTKEDKIYRRSSKSIYYIYDRNLKKINLLSSGGKLSYPTFSPDGSKVAFVRDNNVFFVTLDTYKETQITTDGKYNFIINGSTDWVYEEEFEFTQAFFWSPNGQNLAYYKFDESEVKEYNMQIWSALYPEDYKYKYPKAGEKNSIISIHNYSFANGKTITINTGTEKNNYIPRVKWTQNSDLLSIQRLNRKQNHFEVLHASISTGKVYTAYEEKNNTYVEITDDLTYLKNGKSFLLTSEKDNYRHIYHYTLEGKLINAVTKGDWEVGDFLGADEQKNLIYFTSAEISPLERYLYSIDFLGKSKTQLTLEKGTHEVTMSPGFSFYIDEFSTVEKPPVVAVYTSKGENITTITDNSRLNETIKKYDFAKTEFFQYKTSNNVAINASMLKPANFSETKKYPVFIFIYGGPGYQHVKNSWGTMDYPWFQTLAQKGYVVVTIDNRGTGGRGAAFKKSTQNQLGKLETEDLINAAKHLGSLSYVDKNRIGVFGWSYGGYMSSLAMTVGADFFKMGIAVAPVTSWRFYDTIYTERFLGEPKDNPDGYDQNSPLSHVDKLKGAYLLVHGTGDDNVHVQNSLEMERVLINANKQFQVFYYPDNNHGIYGGYTRLHLYTMMTNFIEKNL